MSDDHYGFGGGSPYAAGSGHGTRHGYAGAHFPGGQGAGPWSGPAPGYAGYAGYAGYTGYPGNVEYPGGAGYPGYAAYPGTVPYPGYPGIAGHPGTPDGYPATIDSASGSPGGFFTRVGWFNFSNGTYLKGLLIGAAAAFVLTNPTVQRTLIRGAVTAWSGLRGGMEEFKEHVQDVKAEMGQRGPE